jgi:S-adenosylmethionine decarboxylase
MTAVVKALEKRQQKTLVVGKHIYGQLYGVSKELLSDKEFLVNLVKESAKVANATILDIKSWKFEDKLAVIAIVLESHISIHTWPSLGFAVVDVYTCGEYTDPEKAFEYIVQRLKPKKVERFYTDRSYRL